MKQQRGVTLVELMVGLVIGLLAILVITQVMTIWEGKKRSTTSGSDAQVSGALALQQLQRDIQGSGYGVLMNGGVGCRLRMTFKGVEQADGTTPFRLAPVIITPGSGTTPDRIRVMPSNSQSFSAPLWTAIDQTTSSSFFTLQPGSNIGNRVGDLMIALPANPASRCDTNATLLPTSSYAAVFNITGPTPLDSTTLEHASGAIGPWNQDSVGTVFPDTNPAHLSYAVGSSLINLGNLDSSRGVQLFRDYSISTGYALQMRTLTARGSTTASATLSGPDDDIEQLFPQVVQLKAVYGKDTGTKDGVADTWNATAPTTADEWGRILAVRIALVVRSTQYEADLVTPAKPGSCNTLTAASTFPKWKPDGVTYDCLDVSGLPDYQHYRYRVFETVVPLRNMIWQS